MDDFQFLAGTMAGTEHIGGGNLCLGKPNQDSMGFARNPFCLVATACDGCSSSQYAEFGSRFAASTFPKVIAAAVANGKFPVDLASPQAADSWEAIRNDLLKRMAVTARQLLADPTDTSVSSLIPVICQHFLFTTVGVLMTQEQTTFFSIGDGYWGVNGTITELPPYPGNAPAYLAYDLIPSGFDNRKEELRFRVNATVPTAEVNHVMIATDGLKYLLDKQGACVPGDKEPLGSLAQLFQEDKYFSDEPFILDPDTKMQKLVERFTGFLRRVNSEVVRLDRVNKVLTREKGLGKDDITVICLRRKKRAEVKDATADLSGQCA